jgi:hypothetical protein
MQNLLTEPATSQICQEFQNIILRGLFSPVGFNPSWLNTVWGQHECLGSVKTVMGFPIDERIQSEHQGKNPGYRKLGG